MTSLTTTTQTTRQAIPTASLLVETIDAYIEMGYEYEDAYLMAQDDLARGVAVDEEDDTDLALENLRLEVAVSPVVETVDVHQAFKMAAMSRGYGEQEAEVVASKAIALKEAGQYTKAYKLYIQRLVA